jgi:hypothetical protein
MNQPLYNITLCLREIITSISNNDGEISPEQEESLAIAQHDLEVKGINYALVIRECEASVYAIDAEIERLTKLKSKPQTLSKKLKEKISEAMIEFGVEKIESDLIKLSFRKSEAVEIVDETLLEAKYFNYKPSIDKTAIKAGLKEGEVPGARMVSNLNLQVK